MDLSYSPEELAFQADIRQWLADRLPADLVERVRTSKRLAREDYLAWHAILRERGFLAQMWPVEYGGTGWTAAQKAIFDEECVAAGAPRISPFGLNMLGPVLIEYGSQAQKDYYLPRILNDDDFWCQGYSEPGAGSDLASVRTRAVRDGDEWVINGEKTWNTGIHKASHDLIFARTSGKAGDAQGITAFLVPAASEGFKVEEYLWTFNMPTDHGRVSLTDVRVTAACILGGEGRGLQVVQHFFNENRIRQAAASLGAAQFCINESVAYAKVRSPFGKPLATNQAIQFPLVELQTQCEMIRVLIQKTAWQMDRDGAFSVSDKVSMCNYWSNRLCCEAADRAMQVHGGMGYSRHKPFEHIYRHHRRYRITEGAEEIQMRRVAGYMFGFMQQQAPKGVTDP